MRNNRKIAGILVIMLLTASLTSNAQKGMKADTLKMKCDSTCMRMHGRHMPAGMHRDSLNMRHGGYGMRKMEGMRGHENMRHMGARPEMMARGMGDQSAMMQRTHGMRMMESIPNLTAKQKEDLTKLNENQQKEMQQLREAQQKQIKSIRDSHLEKVKSILTDEQKKWLEENGPKK
jgi:hypothetical protein